MSAKTCSYCHASPPNKKLGKCASCGQAHYCTVAEQRAHWPQHKATCKFIKAGLALPPASKQTKVVILGAGSTGVCLAYYLTLCGIKPVLIDRGHVACAASGYAGGFLAQNWTDKAPRGPLMRMSWDLHQNLQHELRGAENYDFRRLDTIQLLMPEMGKKLKHAEKAKLQTFENTDLKWASWIEGDFFRASQMGNHKTTAQVHPLKFVNHMWKKAQERGATLVKGVVKDVTKDAKANCVTGVVCEDGTTLPADAVVVALGPWSGQAQKWFGLAAPIIYGQKCHSILLRPKDPRVVTDTAVFVDFDGRRFEPKTNIHPTYEFYPRTHAEEKEVYLHGMDEKWVVPPEDDPLTIKPTPGASDRLKKVAKYVSGGVLASAEHIADQACYMPCAVDGEPVFGHIPGCDGAFIATGTAEWGITMGPAMGKLMAELITGQKPSISIDYFSPRRIPNGYTLQTRIPVEQQKKPTAR